MDYKFGTKNNWRRWLWNRIDERVVDKRDGVVLFLAGQDALDIKEAVRRGFDERDMIAIESDKRVVDVLRNGRVLTVEGKLEDVLLAWPRNKNVSVIVADFCCGMEMSVVGKVLGAIHNNPSFRSCVIATNFLRGRDQSSNKARSLISGAFGNKSLVNSKDVDTNKHRGFLFWCSFLSVVLTAWIKSDEDVSDEALSIAEKLLFIRGAPAFNSYRSSAGTQVFDSCVIKVFIGEYVSDEVFARIPDVAVGNPIRRRIAAVLAHRTMRKAA